jgi:hypothetical protein
MIANKQVNYKVPKEYPLLKKIYKYTSFNVQADIPRQGKNR